MSDRDANRFNYERERRKDRKKIMNSDEKKNQQRAPSAEDDLFTTAAVPYRDCRSRFFFSPQCSTSNKRLCEKKHRIKVCRHQFFQAEKPGRGGKMKEVESLQEEKNTQGEFEAVFFFFFAFLTFF